MGAALSQIYTPRESDKKAVAVAASGASSIPQNINIFVELAKKAVPSVVNISTVSVARGRTGPMGDEMFRKFFEDFFRRHGGGSGGGGALPPGEGEEDEESPPTGKPSPNAPRTYSLGSGFIIEQGLILTNNHVVANADEIKIHFTEEDQEEPTDGEVVGRDPELDLALIKVQTKRQMVPIPMGDSDKSEVGEFVAAVGNPFGQGHSVTHGIISAKGRVSPDISVLARYIQTDAPINPGNSGGPLINSKGEVIAINNAIDARAQGIGFAIPINTVKKVLPQLRSKGTVARGYIGVLVNELNPEVAEKIGAPKDLKAPFVAHVYPDQPADKAGIKPYDIILELNGKKVHSSGELIEMVTSFGVSEKVPVKILRGTEEKTLQLVVGERPGAKKGRPEKPKKKERKSKVDTGMTLEDINSEVARDWGLPENATGALVTAVAYGGAADRAGIGRGDVIIEVDRKPIKNADAFYSTVKEKKSYLVRIRRSDAQGQDVFLVVVLDLKNKK